MCIYPCAFLCACCFSFSVTVMGQSFCTSLGRGAISACGLGSKNYGLGKQVNPLCLPAARLRGFLHNYRWVMMGAVQGLFKHPNVSKCWECKNKVVQVKINELQTICQRLWKQIICLKEVMKEENGITANKSHIQLLQHLAQGIWR